MAEPRPDSAPACEYLNVHEDAVAQVLARLLNLTQSAVSHQLRILKASNLVRFRREGKTVFYSLDDDHVRSVLALGMEHVLEK